MSRARRSRPEAGSELARLRNLGPVSVGWLEAAGIRTAAQLRRMGAVAAFRRVVVHRAGRGVSLNLLYALEGAIRNERWDRLPARVRDELRRAVEDEGS